MNKLKLIRRNTQEIVTEPELKALLKKKRPVVYCGYEPSNPPHLGNLVTTTKLMDFKKAGFRVIFLLADVHAYTNLKASAKEIDRQCRMWEKAIKAFGLNAEFIKGSNLLNTQYWKDVIDISTEITVNRGLRSMQELARDINNAKASQIFYPIMQAVDIKALNCDVAEGGMDQRKVHMLAREYLPKIKYKKPVIIHTPLIVSLLGAGKKMSKSIPGSGISLDDSEKTIEKNIRSAYCPARVLENNPITQIAQHIIFPRGKGLKIERSSKFGGSIKFKDFESLAKAYKKGELHPLDLKKAIAKELNKIIAPARKYFSR